MVVDVCILDYLWPSLDANLKIGFDQSLALQWKWGTGSQESTPQSPSTRVEGFFFFFIYSSYNSLFELNSHYIFLDLVVAKNTIYGLKLKLLYCTKTIEIYFFIVQ